jgi:hypothetical protein
MIIGICVCVCDGAGVSVCTTTFYEEETQNNEGKSIETERWEERDGKEMEKQHMSLVRRQEKE